MSVAGEIERKSGDLDFQEKVGRMTGRIPTEWPRQVKQEMQQNEAIMEALQKHVRWQLRV